MRQWKTIFLGALVAVLAWLAVWLPRFNPVKAQAPPSGACGSGQIDLAEYWFPGKAVSFNVLVCATEFTLPAGNAVVDVIPLTPEEWAKMKAQGAPGDQAYKIGGGVDAEGRRTYFIYSYDAEHVYFLEDQVWDGQCTNGAAAFYRPHLGSASGPWGAVYPRCVADGGSFSSPEAAVTYEKDPYLTSGELVPCQTPYSGESVVTKTVRSVDPDTFRGAPKGTGGDVIAVTTTGGAGTGETMFFTKGKGMTGFMVEQGGPGGKVVFHQVYADGDEVTDLLCEEEAELSEKPVFIYPRTTEEIEKYVANAQVYCAPPQIYQPIEPAIKPILPNCFEAGDQAPGPEYDAKIVRVAGQCNETQYPTIHAKETLDLFDMSFPLFRSDFGGVSIEADLSKTDPEETILTALQKGGRPNYAPRFYLSSPEIQCLSAVRYIKYVQRLCSEWNPGADPAACSANALVTLPDGSEQRLFELAGTLGSEAVCRKFSDEAARNTRRAQIVSSIQPFTPKVFKMGFIVQHIWLYGAKYPLLGQFLTQQIAAWFSGTEDQPGFGVSGGEKLVVVPVWYNSGLTPNEYDQTQFRPYSIDPTTIKDPIQVKEQPTNFAGSVWRTYAQLLPDYVQKSIATDRLKTVDENYELTQQIVGGNLIGQPAYSLTYDDEVVKDASTPPITECSTPSDCLCLKKDKEDKTCQNETYEDLQKAFPEGFEPDNAYLEQLKLQLVARVNAGIQESVPYPTAQETINGTNPEAGPLSERSFNRCEVDPENKKFGQVEEAQDIVSYALQQLSEVVAEPSVEGAKKAITEVITRISGKIMVQNYNPPIEERQQRAYLVLPDEALNIDIEQAYVTPMFLSPEMYASIMKGENPIYPFNLDEDGNPKPTEDQQPLSAFLRTLGLTRKVKSDNLEGYAQKMTTIYAAACVSPLIHTGCTCSSTIIYQDVDPPWVEYDPNFASMQPTPANGCRKEEYIQTSLVDLQGAEPGKSPNANPQTPGQLAALNEFLRRQVFTPGYLQNFQVYPGLEKYYQGVGATGPKPGVRGLTRDLEQALKDLSAYFQALVENINLTYASAKPVQTCDLLYVSQEEATRFGQHLLAAIRKPEIWDWLKETYTGANPFGDCGGLTCPEFIVQTTTSVPVGAGSLYINPLVAYVIAHSEGGPTGGLGFAYGCGIPAFDTYKPAATLDGVACTVETAGGAEVLHPVFAAKYGPAYQTGAVVADTCIDERAGRTTSTNNTPEDGLACFIAYSQGSYVLGNNDVQMFNGYGASSTHGAYIRAQLDLLDELATQVTRAAKATGTYDAEVEAAQQQLRDDAVLLRQRIGNCRS